MPLGPSSRTRSTGPVWARFNKDKLKLNDDGSVDLYFGPKAPADLESNWIPTMGKAPYVWLRLYGPEEAFWKKTFTMPNVQLVV